MDNGIFQRIRSELNSECESVLIAKGKDYTTGNQETDKLYNFRKVAELVDSTPLTVASIYWLKHAFALLKFIKSNKLESEPLEQRFVDLRNYTDLMYAICMEEGWIPWVKESGDNIDCNTGKSMDGQIQARSRLVD